MSQYFVLEFFWCNRTGKLGFYNRSHTASEHRGLEISTTDTASSASDKNEVPESNIEYDDGAPSSLALL